MSRYAAVALLLVGCADEPDGPVRETETSGSTGAAATDGASTSAEVGTGSTAVASEDGSTALDPTVPPVDSTTGEAICAASYGWSAAPFKDVVVVVAADPAALGDLDIDALHAAAQSLASDAGDHVAVAAPPTGNEPPSGAGYESLALPAGTDPLEIATMVQPSAGFRRPYTPLHLVVLTDADTAWDEGMLRGAPEPAMFAQIDARIVVGAIAECDAIAGLAALALDTAGSFQCMTGIDPDAVIGTDSVLAGQPACLLDAAERPAPLDTGDPSLALYGISPTGPQAEFPAGPVACRESPLAWTVADVTNETIGLCPARCRAVAGWYVSERLTADVSYDCEG